MSELIRDFRNAARRVTSLVTDRLKKAPSNEVKPSKRVSATDAFRSSTPSAASCEIEPVPNPNSNVVTENGPYVTWVKENATSSGKKTRTIDIPGLTVDSNGLHTSSGVHVTGTTVLTNAAGIDPYVKGAKETNDGFDQVQSVVWAAKVLEAARAHGLNVEKLLAAKENNGELRVLTNSFDELNAFYSPASNHIKTGKVPGFHTASDHDIGVHETTHSILDHIHPNMLRAGEGGAIHEGTGDADAAFLHDDFEISEDIGPLLNKEFLRNAKNTLTFNDVGTEVHDRGQVYAGIQTALEERLSAILGDHAKGEFLMDGVLFKQMFFYRTSVLTSADYLVALIEGANNYLEGKIDDSQLEQFNVAIKEEAAARLFPPIEAKVLSPQEELIRANVEKKLRGHALDERVKVARAALERHVKSINPAYRIEVQPDNEMENTLKAVYQLTVKAPDGSVLPVVDGFVSALFEGLQVIHVAGRGTTPSATLDVAEGPTISHDEMLKKVRGQIDKILEGMNNVSPELKKYILKNADEIFSPKMAQVKDVVYRGKRAVLVDTLVGEFVLDIKGELLEVNKMMFLG